MGRRVDSRQLALDFDALPEPDPETSPGMARLMAILGRCEPNPTAPKSDRPVTKLVVDGIIWWVGQHPCRTPEP